MHYHQLAVLGERCLMVSRDSTVYDLTSTDVDLRTFDDLARVASIARTSVDRLAAELTEDAGVVDDAFVDRHAAVPVDAEEIWAMGVTYQISKQTHEEESSIPDMYFDVYDADRLGAFLKATLSRTVEPGDAIGVRGDSEWDVPESELGIVLRQGEIIGYTVGNDVSSRSIEGENPLYLPQAKVYDRCCPIGPRVMTPEDVENPHELEVGMTIEHGGEVVYDNATNISEMARSCDELMPYFTRHNTVPELTVILTGTPFVPEQPFDLQEGDHVGITIEGIGTLSNSVTTV